MNVEVFNEIESTPFTTMKILKIFEVLVFFDSNHPKSVTKRISSHSICAANI